MIALQELRWKGIGVLRGRKGETGSNVILDTTKEVLNVNPPRRRSLWFDEECAEAINHYREMRRVANRVIGRKKRNYEKAEISPNLPVLHSTASGEAADGMTVHPPYQEVTLAMKRLKINKSAGSDHSL